MEIPQQAITYILYQRTAYLPWWTKIVARISQLSPISTWYHNIVKRFAVTNSQAIRRRYSADMETEYQSIREYLPGTAKCVLDIGCGVAGIDTFLQRHYGDQRAAFYLLDRSGVDSVVHYFFARQGSFYNSLSAAKTLLLQNGLSDKQVKLVEATDDNQINVDTPVDLALSLISWGYHYPVETYIDRVYDLLTPNGVLILDVRRQTNGLDVLRERFESTEIIRSTKKYIRICARKATAQST